MLIQFMRKSSTYSTFVLWHELPLYGRGDKGPMGNCFPILNISCWTAFIVLSYFFLFSSYYPMKQKQERSLKMVEWGRTILKSWKSLANLKQNRRNPENRRVQVSDGRTSWHLWTQGSSRDSRVELQWYSPAGSELHQEPNGKEFTENLELNSAIEV